MTMHTKQAVLTKVTFGARVAEEELDSLQRYFVETDHWRRLFGGEVDIVYGNKGSGKSALYTLLVSRSAELEARGIRVVSGENPRGAPAFKDLALDPPATELEFVGLWKLYFLCLLVAELERAGVNGERTTHLRDLLSAAGLAEVGASLKQRLAAVFRYAKSVFRATEVFVGLELDQTTGLPAGFGGRIVFGEPSASQRALGFRSVDSLLEQADEAARVAGIQVWICLDRLDVAFQESEILEEHALRALFRAYLDLSALGSIGLKLFLRTDIWKRITASGFREASHITRTLTIQWDEASILNLVVRRAIQNPVLREYFAVTEDAALETQEQQEQLFYRAFPEQVDLGPNKPPTLRWILYRIADGSRQPAPREVIHLLNALKQVQIRKFELGEEPPAGEVLFSRPAFKEALVEVSRTRLEQTLFAEYPRLRPFLDLLRGQRTAHTPETLAPIWELSEELAKGTAEELVEVGFFERRGTRDAPEYWVPFLYRDALDLVQGTAD